MNYQRREMAIKKKRKRGETMRNLRKKEKMKWWVYNVVFVGMLHYK